MRRLIFAVAALVSLALPAEAKTYRMMIEIDKDGVAYARLPLVVDGERESVVQTTTHDGDAEVSEISGVLAVQEATWGPSDMEVRTPTLKYDITLCGRDVADAIIDARSDGASWAALRVLSALTGSEGRMAVRGKGLIIAEGKPETLLQTAKDAADGIVVRAILVGVDS